MPKGWTDNLEYGKFSDELVKSQDREFEKLVLSLIRVIWPKAEVAPAMGWIDRSGIDLLVLADEQPYPLAVQCKGFKVPEEEIGRQQIDHCLKSIASFQKSGIKVDTYLLIHNRLSKNAELRTTVGSTIQELIDSGQAQRAEIWDRQKLLKEAFNATVQLVRAAVEKKRSGAQSYYGNRQICDPLELVPYSRSELVADPNRLISQSKQASCISDPVSELLNSRGSNLSLVLGKAGYGKTTTVLRIFSSTDHLVFYIPASTIPKEVDNAASLLRHCVKLEDLFDTSPNSDTEIFRRLFNTAIKYIFKDRDFPVMLLIDGLDESVYFSRRGGLQSLFNQLRELRFPVILTARKEFWTQRQLDFVNLFGVAGKSGEKQHRKIKLIELLEWDNEQIGNLARRYKKTLEKNKQQKHLDGFIQMIDSDKYENFYGDIPRRPLFLRFILETVAEHGVQHTKRAQLYYEWAESKIRRDITRPMRWGTVGRPPIISEDETADTTLRLAFRAMMLASRQMVEILEDEVELLPDCSIDEILLSDKKFENVVDPTGLFLNSLLVPFLSRSHESLRVQFAHRTYQEFFLALSVKENPNLFSGYKLPSAVMEHLNDLNKAL